MTMAGMGQWPEVRPRGKEFRQFGGNPALRGPNNPVIKGITEGIRAFLVKTATFG